MCYCDNPDVTILDDLKRQTVPDEALVRSCCWSRIFAGSRSELQWVRNQPLMGS